MGIFSNSPQCSTEVMTVGDALSKLKAFNAVFEANKATSSSNNCANTDDAANWRKLVKEGVINCGGEPMELDFFEKMFGGKTETIDAKKLYFKYNCDIDRNIFSASAVTGASPGATAQFALLRSQHSGNGKFSFPTAGYSLYVYEDKQWLEIISTDKTTDFGHLVTVQPYSSAYTANIRKNRKMLVMPVRMVGGLSCPIPASTWQAPGYIKHVSPFRIRVDWEIPIDLLRGFEDVLQFAIMFDENGKEVDCFEAYEKTNARTNMKWAKNLLAFLGQTITNPSILSATPATNQITADYSGFEGYIPTMFYGGGTVMDFDPGVGFDLRSDFNAIMLRNDSLKKTNEYVVLHAKPFLLGLNDNANAEFKAAPGGMVFDSFKRMGAGDIQKLGVQSYSYLGHKLHFKEVAALSDSRGVGNNEFPYQAYFLPGNGLRDSKGKEVPAIQFFQPKGCAESGMFEEHDVDHRKTDGCDILSGHMAETVMMAIHCPNQHILANPVFGC